MRKLLGKLGGAIAGPLLRAATLLLLFSSAFCHAQDISCINDVPTISSITPDTWIAGQTTAVTITGANFCPSQGGIAISDDNGDYPVTYFTINSTTQITFNASPLASDPPATITIWVEDCADACGYTAKTTAQIVQCPPSSIASVLPRTWFAGESYPIKITGKNFMPTVPSGCPAPQVSVSPNGADPGLSGVTVVSDTEIDATVKPDASATTGIAVLQIGNPVHTAVKGQILGNQIMFNGNVISTTDGSDPPVQNVVVGQQIVLTTTPTTTAYEGNPVSQQWTVGPTNIGGYPASTAGASVTPTTLSQPTLTTYWVYPGTAIPVTYKYCVKILFTQGADPVKQCSLPANASFTVTGGGTISNIPFGALTYEQLIPCLGNVRPPLGSPTAPFVVYGNTTGWNCAALYPGSTYGISFQPSGAPSGGTYSYVQLINKDNPTSSDATSSSGCAYSQGVDKTYPYQAIIPFTDPPQAEDAPADDLIPGYVETRTFNATMFLLWTPPGSGSIPVPLGYQSWGFSGGASQDITGAWSATTNGKPGPVGGFVPSDGSQTTDGYTTLQYGYPIWSGPALCN